MRGDEFKAFESELRQLCATLSHRFSDALAQAYWRALKDVPLAEIEAHVERIVVNATSDTKFPKPSALRSSPASATAIPDPTFREMEKRSAEGLEWLRRTNPEAWFKLMGDRNAARIVRRYGTENVFFDADEWCWRVIRKER